MFRGEKGIIDLWWNSLAPVVYMQLNSMTLYLDTPLAAPILLRMAEYFTVIV
jgi:hypothetical protein